LRTLYFISAIFLFVLLSQSCRKERFFKGESTLSFDQDTVYFDTVFTRIPGIKEPRSRNMQLVVRNKENKTIKTSIKLASGNASAFRLNIDGIAANEVNDYEIRGGDSIFIFVECILEANNVLNPAIVVDSIVFNTQGKKQDVKLAAYGWDAYYFNDSVLPCNTVWDKTDKPYVVINSVEVDKSCQLTIEKGVHVYASPNSRLIVAGTLVINGEKDNEVIFEGDRLQHEYKELPGQWGGIYLLKGSVNNKINYAIIKNGSIGIRVDDMPENANPNLVVTNTIIRNMTNHGIACQTATVVANNCLIYSCGFQSFVAFYGGDYDIRHCTFYGYSNGQNNHTEPVFGLNNFQTDGNGNIIKTYDIKYVVVNTIMFGTLENEVGFSFAASKPPSNLSAFEKNLIKVKKPENYNPTNNIVNQEPIFKDVTNRDFSLTAISPAKDAGLAGIGVLLDITGKNRDSKPDIGAYEF